MAHHRSSGTLHRHRESGSRKHPDDGKKRKASSSRPPSKETRHRSRPTHDLSADALEQLNTLAAAGSDAEAAPSKERVNTDEEQRRQRRRERERERDKEKRRRRRGAEEDRRRQHRSVSRQRESAWIGGEATDAAEAPERQRLRDREAAEAPERQRLRDREATPRTNKRQKTYSYQPVQDDGDERGDNYRRSRRKGRRAVSGAILEEGRAGPGLGGHIRGGDRGGLGSGGSSSSNNSLEKEKLYGTRAQDPKKKKRLLLILGGIAAAIVVIIIIAVAAVVASKKKKTTSSDSSGGDSSSGSGSISPSSIPSGAPSWLNPYTWADTTDFNLTYTNETVGGLPIMGLNSSYDNSASANSDTPALSKAWGSYADKPARGVNLGGWLSLEPFITPSLFNYDSSLGIVDEWTLCTYLGSKCASTLEKHYASFVTEATFSEIAAAGLDHVRIPFSYWAVAVYDDDPYVFRTSWRYLLRGIEWARRHGLRVNLDLHALPGSQNGWNHSGRQGVIGWMNGTDGALNVQRSLDIHDQLSRFFAQARYTNVISHYGLANEPRMTFLSVPDVMNWTQTAAALVRRNGLSNDTVIVFGDGFCGLSRWQGQPNSYNLALDVHQYEIFNTEQIVYTHAEKIRYACSGWTNQTTESMDTATGFGPTIVAEWSQADTDCATYLGNVGNGNRWTGTYDVGNASLNALTPRCPTTDDQCSCAGANADPSGYSAAYKQFLLTFAEAQMYSFEKGWGWWYWTWDTENAPQWSYKQGLAAGILPAKASERSFQCDLSAIPSFSALPETY